MDRLLTQKTPFNRSKVSWYAHNVLLEYANYWLLSGISITVCDAAFCIFSARACPTIIGWYCYFERHSAEWGPFIWSWHTVRDDETCQHFSSPGELPAIHKAKDSSITLDQDLLKIGLKGRGRPPRWSRVEVGFTRLKVDFEVDCLTWVE